MKRILICFLVLSLLVLSGCAQKESADQPPSSTTEPTPTTDAAISPTVVSTTATEPATSFQWEQLKTIQFLFSSGAGAWGTILYIEPDGSFSGNFRDSNAYVGPGYPNGCVSYSDFTGRFTNPAPVDAYTYSFQLESIDYKNPIGTEEIVDGTLYQYGSAYGLTDTQEFLLFLPGTPVTALPEYFQAWFGYDLEGTAELPFYGLYNVDQEQSFSGKDMVQQIRASIASAEEAEKELEAALQSSYTQADINIASHNRYLLWDGALNELWAILKHILDEDTMGQLTNDELAWIKYKEQAALDAGAEYEGGSLQPAVVDGTAANLTKERVYELLTYLP